MIDLLVGKLAKRLFCRDVAILVKLNRIDDIVVGNTTLHKVIPRLKRPTLAAINDIVQPFEVIGKENLIPRSRQRTSKIDIKLVSI